MRSTVQQRRNGTDLAAHWRGDAAEPMPPAVKRTVDAGLGWLISMET
jgi:hypothetical protein